MASTRVIEKLLRTQYEHKWRDETCHERSPFVDAFQDIKPILVKYLPGKSGPIGPPTLIDIGCGTGKAAPLLDALGFKVILCDTCTNSRGYAAADFPFIQTGITDLVGNYDVATCIDVMEHIPTQIVDESILSISCVAPVAVFGISAIQDHGNLHVTVKPSEWWKNQLSIHYKTVNKFPVTVSKPNQNRDNWFLFECKR